MKQQDTLTTISKHSNYNSDTIKLTTSGQLFWKKASNEVNSINSSGVRINRAKRITTESVITENTVLPNLKERIADDLWIYDFKKK